MGDFRPRHEKDMRMANAANLQNGIAIFLNPDQFGVIEHVDATSYMDAINRVLSQPTVYSGRTKAKVVDDLPRYFPQNSIIKYNEDETTTDIEYRILKELKAAGEPVPEVHQHYRNMLVVQKIAGKPLSIATHDIICGPQIAVDQDDGMKSRDVYATLIEKCIDTSVSIDSKIDKILTDEDKKYLTNKRVSALAERFRKPKQEIENNIDAYRIMEALEFDDDKFVTLFKPFQERLNQLKEKYGRWIVSSSANNTIVNNYNKSIAGDKAEDITVTDFNHAEFAPTQLSAFYLLDQFMPLKKFNSTIAQTSPVQSEFKLYMLDRFFEEWKKRDPQTYSDPLEHRVGAVAVSIPAAIRQMHYAVQESMNAGNMYIYYDKAVEAFHFLQKINESFWMLDQPQANDDPKLKIESLAEIADFLKKKAQEYVTSRVKEDDFNKALEYMNWS